YQYLVQQEKQGAESGEAKAPPGARGSYRRAAHPAGAGKTKRKFRYRKAAEIEREIGDLETELAELEDLLGQPATWRDPVKAVGSQERHRDLKARLETLYEHWETALDANW